MTNDEKLAAGAIAAWKNNLERADKLFTGLDAQALEKEVSPGRNRLIYLWGHLTATNDRMLSLLGIAERIHPEFDEIFLSSPDRSAELPAIGVMREWWGEVNTKLNDGIAKFTPEDWLEKHTAVSEADFAREPLRNRFAILLNRTNHLAYHLGQTAFVPK
jgi:hypothetical protein